MTDFPYKWGTKEMGLEGPRQRLGDQLTARIHRDFTYYADNMLESGYLDQEERIALSGAISEALKAFTASIPEELSNRRMDYWNRSPAEMLEEYGGP